MLSTLVVSRGALLSSAVQASRYTTLTIQTTRPALNNAIAKQPTRLFSKSNTSMARLGVREKAVPVGNNIGTATKVHNVGMLAIGAAGAAGLGALCYYGLGMSRVEGALERSMLWPQYVRDRIHATYAHLGVGFGISAGAATAALRSPAVMRFFSGGSIPASLGIFAALMASHYIVDRIPYEPGFGPKQLAWISHCSLLGLVLAPLSFVGGPALIRAATYTAGIVGGLSAIAYCAPSEKFLLSSAPLSIGLGFVCASSIASMFLPPTSRIGLGLYGITIYGGLILFSGMLLYDTQKIIRRAELHPAYSMAPYDPISNSLHLYMDIINIFIRMVALGGGQKK